MEVLCLPWLQVCCIPWTEKAPLQRLSQGGSGGTSLGSWDHAKSWPALKVGGSQGGQGVPNQCSPSWQALSLDLGTGGAPSIDHLPEDKTLVRQSCIWGGSV